jgi:citrate lyase subunit beta/citryl-CoA lyase
MAQHHASAFTYLFVPGNRPERFDKALASGADRIILDLEDAVSPADKHIALEAVASWLSQTQADRSRVLVRVNDVTTAWFASDMAMLRRNQPCGVMLSKCESAEQLAAVRSVMAPAAELVGLVETAQGIADLQGIVESPGVSRLALGALDLMVDLDVPADSATLAYAASQMVIASRALGLPQPIAGVTPAMDAQQVISDMHHAMALGFGAKMCIHPMQVVAVRDALTPAAADVEWARRVLHAWNASLASGAAAGAIQVDGKMVDRPVALCAERIVARAIH